MSKKASNPPPPHPSKRPEPPPAPPKPNKRPFMKLQNALDVVNKARIEYIQNTLRTLNPNIEQVILNNVNTNTRIILHPKHEEKLKHTGLFYFSEHIEENGYLVIHDYNQLISLDFLIPK